MNITLAELAEITQGVLVRGDASLSVTGFSTVDEAEAGDVTFLGNPRYLPKLKKSAASVVLAPVDFKNAPQAMAVIAVENPTLAFQKVIGRFGPQKHPFAPGVHPSAEISGSASLDRSKVFIGPNAVIEDDVVIGDGCAIHAGAFLGRGSRLGTACVIHPNAVIKDRCLIGNRVIIHSSSVIGSDGFGYEFSDGKHVKVDQVGIVQIDDDVEIGSCTTIDRARFGRTWIGEGSKIDNLVQIAHNVVIGKHSIIIAQVGISGSTRVGSHVTMAGQVGVAGHLNIGDQITILAKSGITKDMKEPGAYTGYPAKPLMEGRRVLALNTRLPEMFGLLKKLEQRLEKLEESGTD
ncbi:MAG: UDP-3-O-(3-hydroxymyristoyl)glucosamine N-acyltransferase [Verrucomicrobiaceae bacterium]